MYMSYNRNNNIMRAGAKNQMEISLSGAIPAHLCSRITIEKPETDMRTYIRVYNSHRDGKRGEVGFSFFRDYDR